MSATNIWTQGNRGHGAEMYIKALEIPLKQIVTVGDMPSDELMFRKSGVSIAIWNARNPAEKFTLIGSAC
ncbi:MAG: HAD hydrolase family protein [Anaerolineales bacterium]|nr:HAD hydrolase family protein [Anaerolineales bacterium]